MPPWSCPRCGAVNAGQETVCRSCGTTNFLPASGTTQLPQGQMLLPPAASGSQATMELGPGQTQYPGQAQSPGQQTYPGLPPYPAQPAYPPSQALVETQYRRQQPYPGATQHPGQTQYPGQPPYPGAPGYPGAYPPNQPPGGPQQWGAPPPVPPAGGGSNTLLIVGAAVLAAVIVAVVIVVLATRGGSSSTANSSASTSSTISTQPPTTSSSTTSSTTPGSGTLRTPVTVAGETRIQDPTISSPLQNQADTALRGGATGAVAAAYGVSPTTADRIVLAFGGPHPVTAEYTKYLVDQFATGASATTATSAPEVITRGGVQLSCWPLVRNGTAVWAICGWNEAATVGFTVQLTGTSVQTCADFTAAARTAVLAAV